MFELVPIPAFADNYLWLLHKGDEAWIVDPGDAEPVQAYLASHKLQLAGALLTHHHADHTGGVMALRSAWPKMTVYGPCFERIDGVDVRVDEGDSVLVMGSRFEILATPGHTSGHVAYYCEAIHIQGEVAPLLFCGDTLFSAGCGRLFEGTPAQMYASLSKLAALPATTRVCCTHEYTLSNLRFATAVEPDNVEIQNYITACGATRKAGRSTLPSRIGLELKINPFLRCRLPAVQAAARNAPECAQPSGDMSEIQTFAALRNWKNVF